MTDRINTLTVVLEHDIRDDDVQPIVDAIGMVRKVLSVTPNVSDMNAHMAEQRASHEWSSMLYSLMRLVGDCTKRKRLKAFLEVEDAR